MVAPLWKKLKEHHKARALKVFVEYYNRMTWDLRKKELLEKSRNGAMRIDLAKDKDTGKLVGYCVSTISEKKQGEIESIFIEEGYRRAGIGDNFMKKVLSWMDGQSVNRKVVAVAAGNEEVFGFYGKYHFYPRLSILMQVDTKE